MIVIIKLLNIAYPLLDRRGATMSKKIVIRFVGFHGGKHVKEVEVCGDTRIRDVIGMVLDRNVDEVMVVCGSKQLYLDDYIPPDCSELDVYPLASGGA